MRFLIVDDHYLAQVGLTSLLEAEGHDVVGFCGTGEEAVSQNKQLQPDVILMDIRMPTMNGLEALRLIKEQTPEVKVVMVSIAEDENYIMESIRSGADGFLFKGSSGDEFLSCLEALKSGNLALSPCMATQIINKLVRNPKPSENPLQALTKRQVEILHFMALGLSNKEIGTRLMVSENTVKYHLKKILQKTNAQNRTEAVAMAMNSGILESVQS